MRCCVNNSILLIALASSIDNEVTSFAPPHRGLERPKINAFVRQKQQRLSTLQMANSPDGYDFSGPASVEERLKEIQARREKILKEIADAEADSKRLGEQLKVTSSKDDEEEEPSVVSSKPKISAPKVSTAKNKEIIPKVTAKPVDSDEAKFSFKPKSVDKPADTVSNSIVPKVNDVGDNSAEGGMDLSGITGPVSIFGGFVVAAVAARTMLSSRDEVQEEKKEEMTKSSTSTPPPPPPPPPSQKLGSEKIEEKKIVEKKVREEVTKEETKEPEKVEAPPKAEDMNVAVEVELAAAAKAAASVNKPLSVEPDVDQGVTAKRSALFNSAAVETIAEATTSDDQIGDDADETTAGRMSRFRSYFAKKETTGQTSEEDAADTIAEEDDLPQLASEVSELMEVQEELEEVAKSIAQSKSAIEETIKGEGDSSDVLEAEPSSKIDIILSEDVNGSAIAEPEIVEEKKDTLESTAEDQLPVPEDINNTETEPINGSVAVNGSDLINGSEPVKLEVDVAEMTPEPVDMTPEPVPDAVETVEAVEIDTEEQVGGVALTSPLFARSEIEKKPEPKVDPEDLSTTLFPKKTTPSVVPKTAGDIINTEIPPILEEPSLYADMNIEFDEEDRLETFTKVFCEVNDLLQKKKSTKDKKKDE